MRKQYKKESFRQNMMAIDGYNAWLGPWVYDRYRQIILNINEMKKYINTSEWGYPLSFLHISIIQKIITDQWSIKLNFNSQNTILSGMIIYACVGKHYVTGCSLHLLA